MRFLGISPCHDSSVCIINDGSIEVFLKEERLTRNKRDHRPIVSLQESIKGIDEIESFVFAPAAEGSYDQYFNDWDHIVKKYVKINKSIDASNYHHLQHASLAFYNSGFEEAAVIVADGAGSYVEDLQELESIFYASYPDKFIPIYKNFEKKSAYSPKRPSILNKYPDCEVDSFSEIGLVGVYCSGTGLIGQGPLENGKTMGLSSYGEKSNLPSFIYKNSNVMNSSYFLDSQVNGESVPIYSDYFFLKTKDITQDNYKLYADYAYHVQKQTEFAMEYLINKAIEKTNCKSICITGGYGLNVVANSRFLKNFPDINFYFEPIADDSGNSIGAALLSYRRHTQDFTINKNRHTFFHGHNHPIRLSDSRPMNAEEVVDIIASGNSICMYYGLAEAGPRALGHRSIISDARNPNAKNLINVVKNREWYRPFAAACLEEDARKYFYLHDNDGYEFMTVNAEAKEIACKEIPGVIHVDNSCRIQIVKDPDEPLFKLLTEFKKLTGVGVLLNTSFNLSGEPLVETPDDAISTYNRSDLYCLWFPEISQGLIKS